MLSCPFDRLSRVIVRISDVRSDESRRDSTRRDCSMMCATFLAAAGATFLLWRRQLVGRRETGCATTKRSTATVGYLYICDDLLVKIHCTSSYGYAANSGGEEDDIGAPHTTI